MHGTARSIEDASNSARWSTDRLPDRRVSLLIVFAAIPLMAVFTRLGDLQAKSAALIGGTSASVRSVLEPIPARDGRILSSDGFVLAEDIERFSIFVHYRWLERPPNPTWLRGEALRSLSPAERRIPTRVVEAERAVIARREALWKSLGDVTGLSREELYGRFATIQERVSAIHRAVEASRTSAITKHDRNRSTASASTTWWQWAAESIAVAVTTPPRPSRSEPLILAEERDVHKIAEGMPIAVAAAIEADPERFPGTIIRVGSRRNYPQGAVAAHIIGYRFPRSESDAGDDALAVASLAQTGVERAYDRHLRGENGLRRVWMNRRGERVRSAVIREPQVGRDLVLQLELGLQRELESQLDDAISAVRSEKADRPIPESSGGAIVVLNVRTGAILAAASAPRFDLGQASTRDPRFWSAMNANSATPLFDRVCAAELPPGSVFKPVTAVALLESGKIDPDAPFECLGYLDRKDRRRDYIFTHFGVGHGPTTLARALAESCNVYFFHSARTIGGKPILNWADQFGFGRPTGIDLPGEASGHLEGDPRKTDALGIAVGQADLTATPLQVARMTAAIANGGHLVTPHVVRGAGPMQSGAGSVRPILKTSTIGELRADTLERVREGLERTVADPQGTGFKTVRHPKVTIAGKTGTAEVGAGKPDHAWFAGYAPADDPQFAFVVLLEHGGSGGQVAGPVARDVVDALLKRGLLRP